MYDVKPVTTEHHTACGAACMKMLLDYYGIDSDLQSLIEELHIGVAGCTGKDIIRVGNAHGLDVKTWKMDAEGALAVDRPCILWWRRQHFVVFCGLNAKGEPVICNPSSGRFPISVEAFGRLFSGIAFSNGECGDFVPLAEKNYAKGECFTRYGELCKAIAPIAKGAMLTLNTNYIITSVERELAALNQ